MENSISLLWTRPKVEFSTFDLSDTKIKKLIISAIDIRNRWNQPVSWFHVWAAIQVQWCDKEIYVWANCENVNFNSSTHAEQLAINNALLDRKDRNNYNNMEISKIAIVWWRKEVEFNIDNFSIKTEQELIQALWNQDLNNIMKKFIVPCGHCRQIYSAFINEATEILLLNEEWIIAKIQNPETLMPFPFKKIW